MMLHRVNNSMLRILMSRLVFSMKEIVAPKIILFETSFNFSSPNNKRLLNAALSKTANPIAECLQADQRDLFEHCQQIGSARGIVHYPHFPYRTYTRDLKKIIVLSVSMLIQRTKSSFKSRYVSYTCDIMRIVKRSTRKTYFYKQFACALFNRNRISDIFIYIDIFPIYCIVGCLLELICRYNYDSCPYASRNGLERNHLPFFSKTFTLKCRRKAVFRVCCTGQQAIITWRDASSSYLRKNSYLKVMFCLFGDTKGLLYSSRTSQF